MSVSNDGGGSLLAFCNPLLDITANVPQEFLEKYEELTRDYNVLFTAGGSAQNTMRAAQWILPPHSTVFVGCVGQNENASRLREVATADGLQVEYLEDGTAPTGTCACLLTEGGKNRSLVANLGAANNYKIAHVQSEGMIGILERAKIIYISGFFLTVSPETIMYVAKLAHEKGKTLCMNLSAPFVCQFFLKPFLEVLPYVDYLFGNESEAAALAEVLNLSCTDLSSIARHLASLGKISSIVPRTVIITHGSEATHAATTAGHESFSVPVVPREEIVDTNGAGDAFVGGFLSQLVQGKPLAQCIDAGHYLAQVIIRRSGVTFPADHPVHL